MFDCRRWKSDCRSNKRSLAKLHNGAEMCKHILSTRETAQVSVDSLFDGIDFQTTIARYEGPSVGTTATVSKLPVTL